MADLPGPPSPTPCASPGVALKEPATRVPRSPSAKYGQFLSQGVTYLRRTDGKAFLPGSYQLTVHAQTLDGLAVTYAGSVAIGPPLPASPAPASMAATAATPPNTPQTLFDSVGQAAILTP